MNPEGRLRNTPATSMDEECSTQSMFSESYSSGRDLSGRHGLGISSRPLSRKRSFHEANDEDGEAAISRQRPKETHNEFRDDIRSRQGAKHIRTNTYPGCTSTNSPGSPYLWPHIFDSASNGTGVGEISDDWLFSWDMQQESVALSTPAFASTPPALSSSLSSSVFGSPLTPCGEKDTKPRLDFDFLNFGDQSISCNLEATLALPDQGAFPPTSSSWDTFNEVLDTMNARPAGVKPDAPTYIPQPPTSPSPGQQKDFNVKMRTDTSSRSRSRSRSSSIFSSSSSTPSIPLQDGGRQDKQSGDAATTMVLENVGQELMSEILLVVFRSKEQPKLKLYNQ